MYSRRRIVLCPECRVASPVGNRYRENPASGQHCSRGAGVGLGLLALAAWNITRLALNLLAIENLFKVALYPNWRQFTDSVSEPWEERKKESWILNLTRDVTRFYAPLFALINFHDFSYFLDSPEDSIISIGRASDLDAKEGLWLVSATKPGRLRGALPGFSIDSFNRMTSWFQNCCQQETVVTSRNFRPWIRPFFSHSHIDAMKHSLGTTGLKNIYHLADWISDYT
jgi:hypothetical protein